MSIETKFSDIYSAVLLPPSDIIEEINLLKQHLAHQIGPYKGLHSDAHITLSTFKATDHNLSQWETHIHNFANIQQAMPLTFNRVAGFSNGAFVILPDENSQELLRIMMKSFYTNRPKGKNNTSQRAHISIARGLSLVQQERALSLCNTIELSFTCAHISVRKYNRETGLFVLQKQFALRKTLPDQLS